MRTVIFFTIVFAIPVLAFTKTIHVPGDYPKIQQAIDAAANGDTVLVAPGTYVENIDFKGKAITVMSDQGPDVTVIDGNQKESVVMFQSEEGTDSVLDGFTVTNGKSSIGDGGGIYCWDSSPLITNNTISGNSGGVSGGGIYCIESSPNITNNTISGNSGVYAGGGIFCYHDSFPTITNTIIWNNIAGTDSEIHGNPTVTYCDVMGGYPGVGNIDKSPLFVNADDYHIWFVSPCKDAGNNQAVVGTEDFEGDPRIADGVVDMGADEFHTHLYYTGKIPGWPAKIKFVGLPSLPVNLCIGTGVLDPPLPSKWGDWYLSNPWYGPFNFGSIPASGVLTFKGTPLLHPHAGDDRGGADEPLRPRSQLANKKPVFPLHDMMREDGLYT